jgi:hypothetical protein
MAQVVGNADQVRIGPGKLYVAPFGTALPTTLAATLNVAFVEVGFTTEGSNLTYTQTSDGVSVAERLRPIKTIITGVEMTFDFIMAQLNPQNLALAMNAGAESILETTDEIVFVWPKSGGVSRVSIVWQSDDDLERLVLAKCFAGGDISIPRRKGVDPAAVGVTFTVEENSSVTTTIDAVAAFRDAYLITDIDLADAS